MEKRKPVPKDVQDELLFKSGKRCCLCYGLNHDLNAKGYGQIAHLNRNPSDNRFDNLAYMCLDHHSQYDAHTSQSRGFTIGEVKRYRDALYEEMNRMRRRVSWPAGLEIPRLDICQPVEPAPGFNSQGIQFIDSERQILLTFYFKTGPHHIVSDPIRSEKWLHIEANVRPAVSLRIQVRAWNERDVEGLMHFLREGGHGYDLHGFRPQSSDVQTGDYFYVWQDDGDYRMIIATFTTTNAGISIHARFSPQIANELADYLDEVGFASTALNSF